MTGGMQLTRGEGAAVAAFKAAYGGNRHAFTIAGWEIDRQLESVISVIGEEEEEAAAARRDA